LIISKILLRINFAGGGGFLSLIVEPNRKDKFSDELGKLGLKRYSFWLDLVGTNVSKIS